MHLSTRGATVQGRDATQQNEAEDDERSTDVPMAEWIDKLAPGAQQTDDDSASDQRVEPADGRRTRRTFRRYGPTWRISHRTMPISAAETETEASPGWDDTSHDDPAHEAAQRESLAFDPNQDDFDDDDEDARAKAFDPASDAVSERGGPLHRGCGCRVRARPPHRFVARRSHGYFRAGQRSGRAGNADSPLASRPG